MAAGLQAIGLAGMVVDIWLAMLLFQHGAMLLELVVVLHCGYSIGLLFIAEPILRIHVGLILRNELCREFKRHFFYVASNTSKGGFVQKTSL
jgi:hypothetical protein